MNQRSNSPRGSAPSGNQRCNGRTKSGKKCNAPAVEEGLCFFHAHPEKLAELGRQGGRKNRHWARADQDLPKKTLRSTSDVANLLEETINRVRQGPFDLRAANSIGFLASILLKALEDCRIEEQLSHLEAVTGNKEALQAFEFNTSEGVSS